MSGEWPLGLLPIGDVSMGAMLWRVVPCGLDGEPSDETTGTLHLTVALQASWTFDDDGRFEPTTPKPIVGADDIGPLNSDLAPHLFNAEVWFEGDACAVGTKEPSLAVRLAMGRRRALVDKTLHVYGKRKRLRDGLSKPTPFDRLPLEVGRTLAGRHDPAGLQIANVFDPNDAERPSGFARVVPAWRTDQWAALEAPTPRYSEGVLDIPETFDWQAFQATPADQRCAYFAGDEWVVFEGLQPARRRMRFALPDVRAEARLFAQNAQRGGHPIALRCDGVGFDGLLRRVSVRWRGSFPIVAQTVLDAFTIAAGVATGDDDVDWEGAELPVFEEPEVDEQEAPPEVLLPTAGLPQPAHARSTLVGTSESEQMREVLGLPQRPDETAAQRKALAAARLGFKETDAELVREALGIPPPPPSQPRVQPPRVEKPTVGQVDTASLSDSGVPGSGTVVPFDPASQPPPSKPVVQAATTRAGFEAPHASEGRSTITLADGEPSLERVLPFAFADHQRPLEAELPHHPPVSAAPDDEDPPKLAPTIPPPPKPPDR